MTVTNNNSISKHNSLITYKRHGHVNVKHFCLLSSHISSQFSTTALLVRLLALTKTSVCCKMITSTTVCLVALHLMASCTGHHARALGHQRLELLRHCRVLTHPNETNENTECCLKDMLNTICKESSDILRINPKIRG